MKVLKVSKNRINGKFEAISFVNGNYDGHLNIKEFSAIVVYAAMNGYKLMITN